MFVLVSNPFAFLCSLLSCENILSDNETNETMSFCSANLHITVQIHWDSFSLQSVTFSCTKLEQSEQAYSEISSDLYVTAIDHYFVNTTLLEVC